MKTKKPLAFIAALLLTMSSASAANKNEVVIEAASKLPDIKVTVPATAQVFINPYELPVEIESDETRAQIVSVPACIYNESDVPLMLTATVLGKVKQDSDMALGSSPTNGEGTRKKAFLYFEIVAAASEDPDQAAWSKEYDAEKHVLVRTTSKTKKNIVTLDAADGKKPFGVFRLTGDCTATPKQGWNENDGIDVEITFTFTPLARPGT